MYTIYYTDASLFITMKKTYKTLKEAKDWLIGFAEVKRFSFDNELNIDIPNPDSDEKPHRILCENGHKFICINKIENEKGIIFSNGVTTGGQKHWNDEAKDFCRMLIESKKRPVYNFV